MNKFFFIIATFLFVSCAKKSKNVTIPNSYEITGIHDVNFTSKTGNVLDIDVMQKVGYPTFEVTLTIFGLPQGINADFDSISKGRGYISFQSILTFNYVHRTTPGKYKVNIKSTDINFPLETPLIVNVPNYNGWLFQGRIFEKASSQTDPTTGSIDLTSTSIGYNSKLKLQFKNGLNIPTTNRSYKIVGSAPVSDDEVFVFYDLGPGLTDTYSSLNLSATMLDVTFVGGKMILKCQDIGLQKQGGGSFSLDLDTEL